MKINVTGHNTKVTDGIITHLDEKCAKIETRFPGLVALDVILSEEHKQHKVEVNTLYEGNKVAVSGTDEKLFPAIAEAVKKLETVLTSKKGQRQANRHEKPELDTTEEE